MSDMGPDKTDTDWRARPTVEADDGPQRRDDAFGESESFVCASTSTLYTGQFSEQFLTEEYSFLSLDL